jgi:hypothetical protein
MALTMSKRSDVDKLQRVESRDSKELGLNEVRLKQALDMWYWGFSLIL